MKPKSGGWVEWPSILNHGPPLGLKSTIHFHPLGRLFDRTQSTKATGWRKWTYFQSIAVISQLSNIPLKKNYQINGSIGLQNGQNDTNTSLISRATLIARPQQEPRPMSSKLYKKIAQFRRQMANGSKWWPHLTSKIRHQLKLSSSMSPWTCKLFVHMSHSWHVDVNVKVQLNCTLIVILRGSSWQSVAQSATSFIKFNDIASLWFKSKYKKSNNQKFSSN